jgi:uncharacterized protein
LAHPIPKAALDDRLAFVGTAGSGKTYNAGSCVERLLSAKARAVVIDPLGVWWGLRLMADGATESSFNIPIFGGDHGDLALTEHAGALIGETVAGMAESCILDLSQIGTKAGERRFMFAFLTALYRGVNGSPVHLVIDEADMWAPQRLLDKEGEAAKLLGMMETIVRRGRVKGFIPWLITQRPAVLSKDVLSQADGMIAFKLTASQDRDAIGAWIEGQADKQEGKNILAALPSLERGRGFVWIPTRGILETAAFPLKVTFDSSRAPKRGEKKNDAVLRPLDLGKLMDRLSKVEAETKANDPKALKAEIAGLKRELAIAGKPPANDPKAVDDAYQNGLAAGLARGETRARAALAAVESRLKDALAVAGASIESLDSPMPAPLPRRQVAAPPVRAARPAAPLVKANGQFNRSQHRILRSLAMWKALGHDSPSREMVAAASGYSPSSGGFNNLLGGLATAGAIGKPMPGHLNLLMAVDDMTADEGRDMLLGYLSNPQRKLVDALNGAGDLSRDDLGNRTDYSSSSGGFNNLIGSLSTLGLITKPSAGYVALAGWAQELIAA